ncbi:MAG: ABC transporter permease subunit [Luteitalea sp.]|nr:ABC transporter permease subunit [Luteitalea sp.]
MGLLTFWVAHRDEVMSALGVHLILVVASTLAAAAIAVPLGIIAARRPRIGAPFMVVANIVQTIPSLALLGFLIPLPLVGGIGPRAAIVALILYGVLPILRTTVTGIQGVDRDVREAAVALGMTPGQLLRQVELPLALPSMMAGVRVATVINVGTATVAAAIGAGGLGEYIFRGLSMVDSTVILAGAVPAAALALAADALLTFVERAVSPRRRRRWTLAAAVTILIALCVGTVLLALPSRSSRATIVVGSKNFTEQIVLGEIVAQALERFGGLSVERRLNLGGTFICDRALALGEIDVYVEYTGTALTAIFRQPVAHDRQRVIALVRDAYARTGRSLLAPLGFNNTFAILVRQRDAQTLGLRTVSDLARVDDRLQAGFGYEFLERADGYRGFVAAYGLRFERSPRVMELSLTYRALAAGSVDVIAGDATAGLIDALNLTMLEDDRRYFPPYDAVPVVSTATLLREPGIRRALEAIAGRIDEPTMRRLNYAVEGDRRDASDVVREFLDTLDGPQDVATW